MSKLWGGRFEVETNSQVEEFSSSIETDQRLWSVDILASVAHARGLGRQGIILESEANELIRGLQSLHEDLQQGRLALDPKSEDIHSDIEKKLFDRLGPVAGKLHTARSRNDQVATDSRLYLRAEVHAVLRDIRALQKHLVETAKVHTETVLPGFTHLQHAQPVSLAHHLLAYFWMLQRDFERLEESCKRINSLPLGSAALAGTSFDINRQGVAKELGFGKVTENSLDAVSDRDFVVEFLSNGSLIMMHLSRLSEELILWSTPEFGFVQLGDEVTTGSSIMPQKKNPDVAELIRGRVGRLYGALMGVLTVLKGLPLAYNRDLQEDKVFLFEGLDTVRSSLRLMLVMLEKAKWKPENMASALRGDFSNATDLADDLVKKGMPFRQAHEVIGRVVNDCVKRNLVLEDISLSQLRGYSPLFDESSLRVLPHVSVMKARTSEGGTAPSSVLAQIAKAQAILG
jgi:argininosuccinate lyase